MDPLLFMSGTRIARAIRRREVSSLEAVDAHIRQIEKVNPTLNALVAERFALARDEARRADARLASAGNDDELGSFFGVPCTIKESFAVAGMPFTSGLVARKGTAAERDAAAVARLRAAGAIPLGVTNVSELCMWMESDNRVYGRTNNPYDPRRTVGGSSGGEGAIIGAGGAPFGLGADIGGSIRMPAFFNGVFGHKPTGGLVDNGGQYPLPNARSMPYLVTGPLARRAEDLAPLMRALGAEIGDAASVELAGLDVLTVEDDGRIEVSADLRAAQRAAAEALADRGARVKPARFPHLARSIEIWSAMLHAAGNRSFSEMLGNGAEIDEKRELVRWALRRSPHTLPAIALAIVERLPRLTPNRTAGYVARGAALRRELVERIGPRGVMLYPPHPRPAPRHYHAMFPPWNWGYTAILNVMELPVTQVPLGLNAAGVPLGVQVVGVHGNDHVTLAVGLALEKAFGGWVPPAIARAM
jgi:fatty acid amide hydrolase 2